MGVWLAADDGFKPPSTADFELPPVFAPDMFDVRFANNSYVANGNDMTIRVQGAEFPMTITSQGLTGTYTAINAATGEILGVVSSSNALVINNASAILQSTKSASAATDTTISHKIPIVLNGVTYYIALTTNV